MHMILPLQKRRPITAGNKEAEWSWCFLFFCYRLLYYYLASLRRTLVPHTIMKQIKTLHLCPLASLREKPHKPAMKKNLLRFLFIFIVANLQIVAFAQDTSHLRISLLTCTPGEELYSTFGHTAIRVVDSSSVTDYVFNYGTFNFDDDGFYLKFIKGKLMYYLSAEYFAVFKEDYKAANRGITEQVLNLSAAEKISFQQALLTNIKEANKFYKYDFFFDNCTTRPRDLIVQFKNPPPQWVAVVPAGTRFRQAIHSYLDKNEKYWSKLGIDLLLGEPTDAVMTAKQSQFLPDVLMMSLDSSNKQNSLLLSSTNLYAIETDKNKGSIFTPTVVFSLLLIFIVGLSLSRNKWAIIFLQGFDGLLFFLSGAVGILLVFMWTSTDHAMCKNNYNLLWALPTNTLLAFFTSSKKSFIKKYFLATTIFLALVVLTWFFLPQQMNSAFLPIVLLLIYRSAGKYFF